MFKGKVTPNFFKKRNLHLITDKRLVLKIARYVN